MSKSELLRRSTLGSWLIPPLLLACSQLPPAAPDPDDTAPGIDGTSLARGLGPDPSREDRSAWRRILSWPDDCERAFQASFAGEGAGLQFYPMPDGSSLVAVLCAAGSYQPSFRYYRVPSGAKDSEATPLSFPFYGSADGATLERQREEELWGEPFFLSQRGELAVLAISRQTADCGTWARYGFDGARVELKELWARLPCPAEIQPAVGPAAGEPPPGWRRIEGTKNREE